MLALSHAKTCRAEECLNPVARGEFCWTHVKRRQRGQTDAPRGPSRSELLREAAIRMADADADNDVEFERADANLRKMAKEFATRGSSERIREGIAKARAKGIPVGRPAKLTIDQARTALAAHHSVEAAAKGLGVSRWTLQRTMRRGR